MTPTTLETFEEKQTAPQVSPVSVKSPGTQLQKPTKDTQFAHESAKLLKDIVNQNGWAVKLGQGEHLKFEAWQTIGTYYGYTVKTHDANFAEYGAVKGFE